MKTVSTSEAAIRVRGLRKSFKDVSVLKGIDLQVKRGTMLALLGPNGAGKTTIVRILSTLLKPDDGEVRVNGFDAVREADKVRGTIGLTGQYAAVDEYLTGRENLEMMGRLYHLSRQEARRRTEDLLGQFDLAAAADRGSKTYSGGMRRRLDLAASLIATPPIIFLDEPTTGLDPRSRLVMWDVIRCLMSGGTTILLTTQYLDEADQLADRIAVINDGRIVANGTASELKKTVGDDRVEFSFANAEEYKHAVKVLVSKQMTTNERDKTVSVVYPGGTKELYAILGKLDHAKLNAASVALHKPTLDDVFLKLTGKAVKSQARNDKKGA